MKSNIAEKLEKKIEELIDEIDPKEDRFNIVDISSAINDLSEAYNKIRSVEFLLSNGAPIGDMLYGQQAAKFGN